jgi:hypothetical protein
MGSGTRFGLGCLVSLAVGIGCKGGSSPIRNDGSPTDLAATDTGADLPPEVATTDGAGDSPEITGGIAYTLLVTETPPGPIIEMSKWGGVRRYTVAAAGAPLVLATGIDKTAVHDPENIIYRPDSSEVLVANRHGDNAADGMAGSISRFIYDRSAGTFTPNGAITGNGLSIVGQMAFHPTTGELFAANLYLSGGGPAASRFTIDGAGVATANGTIGDGGTQGLLISPDGKRLYLTSGGLRSNAIRQYDIATGAKLPDFTVTGAASLFFMALSAGEIYVGDIDGNKVFRLTVDASNDLTVHDSFGADGPVSIAFSPDGTELFSSGHLTSSLIDRFVHDATGTTWMHADRTDTTQSLGGLIVVPAP